jgi:hypothetical protein
MHLDSLAAITAARAISHTPATGSETGEIWEAAVRLSESEGLPLNRTRFKEVFDAAVAEGVLVKAPSRYTDIGQKYRLAEDGAERIANALADAARRLDG